jgi:pimeloyl-ACP methyl ester carboxylesterase
VKSVALLILVLAVFASACTDNASDGATTTSTTTTGTASTAGETPGVTPSAEPEQPTQPVDRGYDPFIREAECAFEAPLGTNPECGFLVVPEDRDDPTGTQIRLHVAVFRSVGDSPQPDPIVYLDGGPGAYTLDQVQLSYTDRFEPFTMDRDLILFDQRGVGFSEPNLSCPEVREVTIDLLDEPMPPDAYNDREATAVAACAERIGSEDIDVTAYTSADNAADVADLREALGYETWNLYGISYGTRLALTTMRDHPQGIRSVILDSTVPLQNEMLITGPEAAQRAFDTFFGDCAGDATCAAAFPNLEATYDGLVVTLNETPAAIEIEDFTTGDRYPAMLTGDDLTGLMFQGLYSEQIIPLLPDMLTGAAAGDMGLAARVASAFFTQGNFFSYGMYVSVQCAEEYAFTPLANAELAARAFPEVEYIYADAEGEYEECEIWGAGTADEIETLPVVSPIPTLIVGGEFDPITPPSYGATVAADLEASFFYEFPGLAHGVTTAGDCPLGITLGFLADPTTPPDATCIEELAGPAYFIPGAVEIVLVPFEEDFLNVVISGVVPDDWSSQGFGAFVAPGLGDSAIIQQVIPAGLVTYDALISDLGNQFEVSDPWETSTYTDARDWTVYSNGSGDLLHDVALAEDGGFLYIVMLLTVPELHEEYVSKVLHPALAAIDVG